MTYWRIIYCKLEKVGRDSAQGKNESLKTHTYVKRNSKLFKLVLLYLWMPRNTRQSTVTVLHSIKKKRRKEKGAIQSSLVAYSTVGNIFIQM